MKRDLKTKLKEAQASRAQLDTYIKLLKDMMRTGSSFEIPTFTVRKKPGPKPKLKLKAARKGYTKSGAERKKPGPKPGFKKGIRATASAKPPVIRKATGATKALKPQKAGEKPSLKDAITLIMLEHGCTSSKNSAVTIAKADVEDGSEEKAPICIVDELKARRWMPTSSDPIGYVRYTLSKERDLFLRVGDKKGRYFLNASNTRVVELKAGLNGAAAPVVTPEAAPKAKKAKAEAELAPVVVPEPVKAAPVVEVAPVVVPEAETPKAKAAAPKVEAEPVKAAPTPKVETPKAAPASKPVAKAPVKVDFDEDPNAIADDILAAAGIDMTSPSPFAG